MGKRRGRVAMGPTLTQKLWLGAAAVVVVGLAVVALTSTRQPPPPSNITSPAPTASASPEQTVHQAVMLGDSYFNGWGKVPQAEALGNKTALALGYTPVLRGTGATGYVSGRDAERAGGEAGNFIQQLADDPVTNFNAIELVVVNGGLADRSAAPEQFELGMRNLIAEIRKQAPGARIVILGPPNVTPRVEESGMDERQRDIAAAEGVDYISFDALMPAEQLRPSIDPDDLTHPQPQTVPILIDLLAQRLREIGVPDYRAP